jgi:triosephosphate isomerase (TIM)
MPQLIAGNWKMNGLAKDAVALAQAVAAGAPGIVAELLVCPAALHVAAVAHAVQGSVVAVGGQDCHQARQGAHTGDIAGPMLRDAGATWVILGHSERRQNHGETDELVREKTLAAVAAGLIPIVCVGETADQRSLPAACPSPSPASSPMSRSGPSALARPPPTPMSPPCTRSSVRS